MTNTEADIRTARAELAGIIEQFDAGEFDSDGAVAEALEHSLDYVRVLLGLVDLSEEDEFEVTFDQNACAHCTSDVEASSDEPGVWRDRGGSRACSGGTYGAFDEWVPFPAGQLHTAEFRR